MAKSLRYTSLKKYHTLTHMSEHLRDIFLDNSDFRPRTINQLLKETSNTDMDSNTKDWYRVEALPAVRRISVIKGKKYVYNPPLACRNSETFIEVLKDSFIKEGRSILKDDVLASIPKKEKPNEILNRWKSHYSRIVREDKKEILTYRDLKCFIPPVDASDLEKWNSATTEDLDDRIGRNLKRAAGSKTLKRRPTKPKMDVAAPAEVAESVERQKLRCFKNNAHVVDDLWLFTTKKA